jgi:hypothetical protein
MSTDDSSQLMSANVGEASSPFLSEAALDAPLQPVPNALRPTPERVEWNAETIGKNLAIVDLHSPVVFVVAKNQLTALG